MEPAKVYWMNLRARPGRSLLARFDTLLRRAGLETLDLQHKFVALKLHFGEPGNLAYIRPNYVARVVALVEKQGGKPFLTDCNTLYTGQRSNAVDHLRTAQQHGFNRLVTGCDVIIADGLKGTDYREIPLNFKHCRTAKIGTAIADADALISLNHFKGHDMMGFGGAIKNIGMGSGSRGGKLEMHSASKPRMKPEKCVSCGMCLRSCPQGAIHWDAHHKAEIDYALCIGCGQCVAVCAYDAAQAVWDESSDIACEKMAEYAYAVLQGKPALHVNFVMNVSPNCDCWSMNDAPIVPDLGIAASLDPVALDRACVDLVNAAPALPGTALTAAGYVESADKFATLFPRVRWQTTLEYAEAIGLGTQQYSLEVVE